MLLHLEGARLSKAAAALNLSFADFTTKAGVDLVSLGGTKIGALAAEAVIVTNTSTARGKQLADSLPFLRKTPMQLASKMRFVSCQRNALFENGAAVAIANASHANAMADKLYKGITEIAKNNPAISVPNKAEANAVFPILPAAITEKLQQDSRFYVWNRATGQVRLMCSFDTTEEDVEGLLAKLEKLLAN